LSAVLLDKSFKYSAYHGHLELVVARQQTDDDFVDENTEDWNLL